MKSKPSKPVIIELVKNKKLLLIVTILILFLGSLLEVADILTSKYGQNADIFLVSDKVSFGETTLNGYIKKDAPPGIPGLYYLVLPDERLVVIDPQSDLITDKLIGSEVILSGKLEQLDSDRALGIITPELVN